jgi:hypothetical protein
VTIHVAGRALPVRALAATDPSSVRRTSEALVRKYAADPALKLMLVPDILDTTLRVVPA